MQKGRHTEPQAEPLREALETLRRGGVVAAATESFYGLLADATSASALDQLFTIKPRDRGVALIIPDQSAWAEWVEAIPPQAQRLAAAFWPGPLTIALPARSGVDPRLVVDGTVGVRLPVTSPALELSRALGGAVTATSANAHGHPPATTDAEVRAAFGDLERAGELRIVPGQAPGGAPSTVVVVQNGEIFVARPGAITDHDIKAAGSRAL